MPEEDDDALGQMLGDRLKGSTEDLEQEVSDETDTDPNKTQEESVQSSESSDETDGDTTESTQRTQSTDTIAQVERDAASSSQGEDSSVRSRSPFPLYVTPELKETVQRRFETFNAHRTLNDDPQVEKHKHFMEGLLRAGLAHSELEEYILDEFEDN